MAAKKKNKKEDEIKINMSFEDALKKALNTSLPESEKKIKSSTKKNKSS